MTPDNDAMRALEAFRNLIKYSLKGQFTFTFNYGTNEAIQMPREEVERIQRALQGSCNTDLIVKALEKVQILLLGTRMADSHRSEMLEIINNALQQFNEPKGE